MTNKGIYQATFSQIHSSGRIRWEDMKSMNRMNRNRRYMKRSLLVAAVVCCLTAIVAAGFAAGWFSLRDAELTNEITVQQPDGTKVTVEIPTGRISLQGFGEMPEKLAVEEWHRFLDSYDDGGALEALGNGLSGFEEEYGCYRVYTQEMADKLEEIADKYSLKLHTDILHNIYPGDALCAQVGGDFLGNNFAGAAYMYEDGTFKFDGWIDLEDYGNLDYQFMRCVYGSFTDVILNIGNASDFVEWSYVTESGVSVTLALSSYKALVIADLPDSFVTINVFAGTGTPSSDVSSSGAFTAEDLERFADSFDFSVLTPVQVPKLDQKQQQTYQADNELFLEKVGFSETEAQQFYARFYALMENGEKQGVAELLSYPAVVTVESGTFTVRSAEEFMVYFDDIFTDDLWESIIINQYTRERADLFVDHGMVGAAGGAIHFAAVGNDIYIVSVENLLGRSIRQEVE